MFTKRNWSKCFPTHKCFYAVYCSWRSVSFSLCNIDCCYTEKQIWEQHTLPRTHTHTNRGNRKRFNGRRGRVRVEFVKSGFILLPSCLHPPYGSQIRVSTTNLFSKWRILWQLRASRFWIPVKKRKWCGECMWPNYVSELNMTHYVNMYSNISIYSNIQVILSDITI